MRHAPASALVALVLVVTAGAARAQVDGGVADGGAVDGGAVDAGAVDGGGSCALDDDWVPGASAASDATLTAWTAELAAHGAVGEVRSFDLSGPDIHLVGDDLTVDGTQAISALLLHGGGDAGTDYLFVENATVSGQQGTLVVQGPRLVVTAGALAAAVPAVEVRASTADEPSVVIAEPEVVAATALTLTLSSSWSGAAAAAQTPVLVPLDVTGLTLGGHTRAVLVTAAGETTMGGSIAITSGGAVYARAAPSGTAAVRIEAETLRASGTKLGLAGDFTSGALTTTGGALTTVPKAVLVRGGPVVVRTTGASATSVRVTQALAADGPLLQADLEILSTRRYLRVAPGDMEYLAASVREAGFEHDALFGGIEVEGCLGVEAVQAVVSERLPSFVEIMLSTIEVSGWAAPIVAIAVILTLPGAILLDAFVSILDGLFCLFGCPSPPPPPVAYPAWLEPGEARPFELVVHGDQPAGDYPTRIRVLGKNHAPVELDVLVRVGMGTVPAEWRCSIDAYGSFDGCDCGCGAVDPDCAVDDAAAPTDACDLVWCATNGSNETIGGTAHDDDLGACLTAPAEWTCASSSYAAADGQCDCGCGAFDPDCGDLATTTATSCSTTWCAGAGSPGGRLQEGSVTACLVPPSSWFCGEAAFGDAACDCGCGALDVDCPAGAGVADCVNDGCNGEVDPDDLTRCLVSEGPTGGGPGFVDDDEDEDDDGFDCAGGGVPRSGAPTALAALALAALLAARSPRRRRVEVRAARPD